AFFSAFRPKSKEYYGKYIKAQQLLACYRIVQQELATENTYGHGHGHEHGHGHGHDGHSNDCEHYNVCCGGHSHGHSHGHGNGQVHGQVHCHGHSHGNGCCGRQEFAMPADIEQFKSQLPSYANPNLYNGNRYLDVLNRKLLGKGAQDFKLTLRGIKELTKKLPNRLCLKF
ncbi:MAG: hypothetical protein EBT55_03360, partial [Proteobacteria bacterium]|nr:hypothetical protein [Pseudomonadota bacterium]